MPPIAIRRVLIDPVTFLFALVALMLSPFIFAAAFLADLFIPGEWRVKRLNFCHAKAMVELLMLSDAHHEEEVEEEEPASSDAG